MLLVCNTGNSEKMCPFQCRHQTPASTFVFTFNLFKISNYYRYCRVNVEVVFGVSVLDIYWSMVYQPFVAFGLQPLLQLQLLLCNLRLYTSLSRCLGSVYWFVSIASISVLEFKSVLAGGIQIYIPSLTTQFSFNINTKIKYLDIKSIYCFTTLVTNNIDASTTNTFVADKLVIFPKVAKNLRSKLIVIRINQLIIMFISF